MEYEVLMPEDVPKEFISIVKVLPEESWMFLQIERDEGIIDIMPMHFTGMTALNGDWKPFRKAGKISVYFKVVDRPIGLPDGVEDPLAHVYQNGKTHIHVVAEIRQATMLEVLIDRKENGK